MAMVCIEASPVADTCSERVIAAGDIECSPSVTPDTREDGK